MAKLEELAHTPKATITFQAISMEMAHLAKNRGYKLYSEDKSGDELTDEDLELAVECDSDWVKSFG